MSDEKRNLGFIYFATNPSMPGIVKIGCSQHPKIRVQQLSTTTSVPTPFEIRFYQFVLDMERIEQTLHRMLDHCRVNPDREFFQIDVEQAVKVFSSWTSSLALIPIMGIDYEITPDGYIQTLHQKTLPLRRLATPPALTPEMRFVLWNADNALLRSAGMMDPLIAAKYAADEFYGRGGAK